jgi:DNA polymerase III subunit alpha
MTKFYKFNDCGCEFEIINEDPLRLNFQPDIEKISLDCKKAWELIGEKSCRGVFQLDSHFAEHITHQFKPNNIGELGLCIAMNRPGCLDAYTEDNKTITQSILDRRNNKEEIRCIEPIKDFLKDSYGHMVYQEQMMFIAAKLAGFDPGTVNLLRKAAAKKKPELMVKLKLLFIEGCKRVGLVDEDNAKKIFENIEATQRYGFNLSHSIVYAQVSYLTAYSKCHFPLSFYKSALKHAIDKQKPFEEINYLVSDARNNSIDVRLPDIRNLNKDFALINREIYVGLGDIRGIGESTLKQLIEIINETEKKIGEKKNWRWLDFLLYVAPFINSTAAKALICSGSFDFCRIARSTMYYEYEQFMTLKDREQTWIIKRYEQDKQLSLIKLMEELTNVPSGRLAGGCSSGKRLEAVKGTLNLLKTPPFNINDSVEWLAGVEEELMGVSLSCTKVDACDASSANCECRDFIQGYNRPGPILIALKIDRVKEITTKKKDQMCFLEGSDITGSLESIVVFPQVLKQYKSLILEGNVLMLSGKRDEKIKNNLIVDKIWQL